jgi:hypothetical protein
VEIADKMGEVVFAASAEGEIHRRLACSSIHCAISVAAPLRCPSGAASQGAWSLLFVLEKRKTALMHEDGLFNPRRRFSELSFRTSSGLTAHGTVVVFLLGCRTFSGHS